MENSSKALIMAGEILIAIIILSILAAVIVSFGRYSSDMHEKIADQETYQFNSNFLDYSGRVNITAQEIATIINFAKKENDKNNFTQDDIDNEAYVNVWIDNIQFFAKGNISKNNYENNVNFNKVVSQFVTKYNTKYFRCDGNFKTPIETVNGVKEIWTTEATSEVDIGYNSVKKVNLIKFHRIKENSDDRKTYDVTDSIVVNPYKDEIK